MDLPLLHEQEVNGKRFFVRCDFDVPLSQSAEIEDETRLISSVSTIEFILENGGEVIAAGHLGRPQGEEEKFSLKPVADWFSVEFGSGNPIEVALSEIKGWKIKERFSILENLRFIKGEEENDPDFSKKLATLGEVYINEAFGSSHRSHASIVGVPALLPHFAGFHLTKEVKVLSKLLEAPQRPLTFIVGGAKIETKLPLISKMHRFADYVLVGGELAEQDKILIKEQHENITEQKAMLLVADLTEDKTDITQMSLENFSQIILRSKTIIWNGPMGFIEKDKTHSSLALAEAIIGSSAYKVVGGGDTIGLLNKNNMLSRFDFVSTGGGAMLEFLSGVKLPGITALT